MKRWAFWAATATVIVLAAAPSEAFAQGTFTITFPFKAGASKLPKGEYQVAPKDGTQITLRQAATGKEFQIPFTKRLPQPHPPVAEPQIIFHVVGDFAPSYTDYVTVYVLAEVWLPGAEGFLIHTTKGAHKTEVVRGQKPK